ncbi:hypothetical protein D3C83_141170 [compost metagenome]
MRIPGGGQGRAQLGYNAGKKGAEPFSEMRLKTEKGSAPFFPADPIFEGVTCLP